MLEGRRFGGGRTGIVRAPSVPPICATAATAVSLIALEERERYGRGTAQARREVPLCQRLVRRRIALGAHDVCGRRYRSKFRDCFEFIHAVDPALHSLLSQLIAVVICQSPAEGNAFTGGSISSMAGCIWLTPSAKWTVVDFADRLVHELLHNVLHLEDMVRGLIGDEAALQLPAHMVYSTFRRVLRPYDMALHAAVVSGGLSCFLRRANLAAFADKYLLDVRHALPGLLAGCAACLTRHGAEHVEALATLCAAHEDTWTSQPLPNDAGEADEPLVTVAVLRQRVAAIRRLRDAVAAATDDSAAQHAAAATSAAANAANADAAVTAAAAPDDAAATEPTGSRRGPGLRRVAALADALFWRYLRPPAARADASPAHIFRAAHARRQRPLVLCPELIARPWWSVCSGQPQLAPREPSADVPADATALRPPPTTAVRDDAAADWMAVLQQPGHVRAIQEDLRRVRAATASSAAILVDDVTRVGGVPSGAMATIATAASAADGAARSCEWATSRGTKQNRSAVQGLWRTLTIVNNGGPVGAHAVACPGVVAAVAALQDAMRTALGRARNVEYAGFFHLGPGSVVATHCGSTNLRLRAHLGLTVPPSGATLRVAGEERRWSEGGLLVFDDSFEHEARNESETGRVVLCVDVWHPQLSDVEINAVAMLMDDFQ